MMLKAQEHRNDDEGDTDDETLPEIKRNGQSLRGDCTNDKNGQTQLPKAFETMYCTHLVIP